jgi:hypothetical protein
MILNKRALGKGMGLFCCLYVLASGYDCFCAFGQTKSGLEIVMAGPARQTGLSGTSVSETQGDNLTRLRQGLGVVDSQSNSVFRRVVVVGPSPSPSAVSHGGPEVRGRTSSGGSAEALGSPTPAAVTIVEKVGQPDVAVAGSKVLSAVVGAPGLDSPGESGDLLDGVLEAENNFSGPALRTAVASPSTENGASQASRTPSAGDGVIITGEPAFRSPLPVPTPSVAAQLPEAPGTPSVSPTPAPRNDLNANPAVQLPTEPLPEPAASPPAQNGPDAVLPSASASPSPSPESSAAVQDKVYDLVSGRLPDRNLVRGPAEPRVGFYPKAPEAKTARNLFLEASGADLPREEAGLW